MDAVPPPALVQKVWFSVHGRCCDCSSRSRQRQGMLKRGAQAVFGEVMRHRVMKCGTQVVFAWRADTPERIQPWHGPQLQEGARFQPRMLSLNVCRSSELWRNYLKAGGSDVTRLVARHKRMIHDHSSRRMHS